MTLHAVYSTEILRRFTLTVNLKSVAFGSFISTFTVIIDPIYTAALSDKADINKELSDQKPLILLAYCFNFIFAHFGFRFTKYLHFWYLMLYCCSHTYTQISKNSFFWLKLQNVEMHQNKLRFNDRNTFSVCKKKKKNLCLLYFED